MAGHAGLVRAALDNMEAAVDAHKAALDAEIQMYAIVESGKINWLDGYKLSHRGISHIYYQDSRKADTYFKPGRKPKKAPPADEPPAKA